MVLKYSQPCLSRSRISQISPKSKVYTRYHSFIFYCFLPHISRIFYKSKLVLQSQEIRLRQGWLYVTKYSVEFHWQSFIYPQRPQIHVNPESFNYRTSVFEKQYTVWWSHVVYDCLTFHQKKNKSNPLSTWSTSMQRNLVITRTLDHEYYLVIQWNLVIRARILHTLL